MYDSRISHDIVGYDSLRRCIKYPSHRAIAMLFITRSVTTCIPACTFIIILLTACMSQGSMIAVL